MLPVKLLWKHVNLLRQRMRHAVRLFWRMAKIKFLDEALEQVGSGGRVAR